MKHIEATNPWLAIALDLCQPQHKRDWIQWSPKRRWGTVSTRNTCGRLAHVLWGLLWNGKASLPCFKCSLLDFWNIFFSQNTHIIYTTVSGRASKCWIIVVNDLRIMLFTPNCEEISQQSCCRSARNLFKEYWCKPQPRFSPVTLQQWC